MHATQLEAPIQKLPPHLKNNVLDYVEFLVGKYAETKPRRKKFKFDWEGELANFCAAVLVG